MILGQLKIWARTTTYAALNISLPSHKLLIKIEIEAHTWFNHVRQDKDRKSKKSNKYWDSLESCLEVFLVIHLLEIRRL